MIKPYLKKTSIFLLSYERTRDLGVLQDIIRQNELARDAVLTPDITSARQIPLEAYQWRPRQVGARGTCSI